MSERDPIEVLRERTARLEEELRELDARRRERAALDAEVARVETELGKTSTLLDRFGKRRALPMLDATSIASPCTADWDGMVGDDKVRYCGKCEKNVFNLSAMTREEAEITILAKNGDLCVRLYQRHDGTVLTQDCPVGVRRKRLRLVGALAIGSSLAGAALAAVVGTDDEPIAPPPPTAITEPTYVPVPIVPVAPPTVIPAPPGDPLEPPGRWVAGGLRAPDPPPPPPKGRHLMGKPAPPPPEKPGKPKML